MKKILFIIYIFCFINFEVTAQQLPQFSQYMFNTIAINPAYAGTRENITISLMNRNQWVGVNGAPVTSTLAVDTSIPGSKIGLGLSMINDQLGFENTTFLFADMSYTIRLNHEYILSLGVKAGASVYSLDDEIYLDPSASTDTFLDRVNTNWKPNFGMGIYLRNEDDNWFLGVSSPRLIEYNNIASDQFLAIERSSYYLHGGLMLKFNPKLTLKPTFQLKYVNGAPVSIDATANFLLNENLWLGASYRFGDAIGGYINFKLWEELNVGYTYEFITSSIGPYTSGSHEIFLSFRFDLPRSWCGCANPF